MNPMHPTVCSYAVRRALSLFSLPGSVEGGGGVSIYIYIYARPPPPPHDPHIWPREGCGCGVLGGGGLQTPDFQKKSGVPPDSRLQISRKIWSTRVPDSRLQISRKKSGVPPDSRLQISRKNLEYLQTPDSRFPEKIWSTGTLDSRFWSL